MHAPHLGCGAAGAHSRTGTISAASVCPACTGGELDKLPTATAGEVVALGRLEETATGDVVDHPGRPGAMAGALAGLRPGPITATSREDGVKLSGALQKLVEEDRLVVNHNAEMSLWKGRATRICGWFWNVSSIAFI